MGERGSPIFDIVEQIIGNFENTLANNVLVRPKEDGALAQCSTPLAA